MSPRRLKVETNVQLALLCTTCGSLLQMSEQQRGLCDACHQRTTTPEPPRQEQLRVPQKRWRPRLAWVYEATNEVLEQFSRTLGWDSPRIGRIQGMEPRQLRELQFLYIAAAELYLDADAPYGNHRAGMLRWWGEQEAIWKQGEHLTR